MDNDLGSGYIEAANTVEGNQTLLLVTLELPNEAGILYFSDSNEETITAKSPIDEADHDYTRIPMQLGTIDENLKGELPRVTLTVGALPNSLITSYVRGSNGLIGQTIHIVRTYRHLIGSAEETTNRLYFEITIDYAKVVPKGIEFGLASKLELANARVPKRIFYRNYCNRAYKEFDSDDWVGEGVINSSFESNLSNTWFYGYIGAIPPATVTRTTEKAYIGNYSLKMVQNGISSNSFKQHQNILVDVSDTYELTVKFWAAVGNYARINLYHISNPFYSSVVKEGNGDWQTITTTRYYSAGQRLTIYLYSTDSSVTNTVHYDDVQVKSVTDNKQISSINSKYEEFLEAGYCDHADTCLRSTADCKEHLNIYSSKAWSPTMFNYFGGFPFIPSDRRYIIL